MSKGTSENGKTIHENMVKVVEQAEAAIKNLQEAVEAIDVGEDNPEELKHELIALEGLLLLGLRTADKHREYWAEATSVREWGHFS